MIQALVVAPFVSIAGLLLGLAIKGVDRIIAARMQARVGPPIAQPFIDIRKLLMKESVLPKNAVRVVFEAMPMLALVFSLVLLLYVPLFGFQGLLEGHGDLIVLLYLFAVPSLAMAVGGFSSGSPYATVGAQREIVTMVSYELPLAISFISIAWLVATRLPLAAAFSLGVISQAVVWSLVGPIGLLGLGIFFLVLLAPRNFLIFIKPRQN